MKRVPAFDILSTLFRVCFSILCSSIGTKLTWMRTPRPRIGMNDVWQQQSVKNEKMFLFIAKQNLKDLANQKIDSFIDNSNKCLFYKYIPRETYNSVYVKVFLQNVERV